VRWQAYLSIALLLALPLAAGCAQDPGDDGANESPGDGEEDTYERCDTVIVPYETNGTQWEAALVECEANVTGTNSQTMSCAEPGEAELTASANLTSGEVEIRVEDDEGEPVAEHRLGDTNGEARELSVDEGADGDWRLAGERLDGFEGDYQAELACPRG
jgi:hypothetical protein